MGSLVGVRERFWPAAAWAGLVAGAAALTGLVTTTVSPPTDEPGRAPPAAITLDHDLARAGTAPLGCALGQGASRASHSVEVSDGPEGSDRAGGETRNDPHALTPAEAEDLDRQLREVPVDQVPQGGPSQEVPVVVHVISAADGTGDLDEDTVLDQLSVLNGGFSGAYGGADTGFRFQLQEITRTQDDAWFHDFGAHEREAKQRLRSGGAEVLNIYSVNLGDGVLGRSTFPQDYAERSSHDGVVLDHRTVPDGGRANFDLGHTATHEVGHWLGLFHTFQNGCAFPGDYVADTPYERFEATGCPEGRNSCSQRWGTDPVHNFMNYSNDACLSEFTAGQAQRMARAWFGFRDEQDYGA